VVERLPSKHKALSSNSSAPPKKMFPRVHAHPLCPADGRVAQSLILRQMASLHIPAGLGQTPYSLSHKKPMTLDLKPIS
jgi:hypothetical protein